jgi:hypothetical protein
MPKRLTWFCTHPALWHSCRRRWCIWSVTVVSLSSLVLCFFPFSFFLTSHNALPFFVFCRSFLAFSSLPAFLVSFLCSLFLSFLLCGQGSFHRIGTYGIIAALRRKFKHFAVSKTSTSAMWTAQYWCYYLDLFVIVLRYRVEITPVATALLPQYPFLLHSELRISCNFRLLLYQYSTVCKNSFLLIVTGPAKRIDMAWTSEIHGRSIVLLFAITSKVALVPSSLNRAVFLRDRAMGPWRLFTSI